MVKKQSGGLPTTGHFSFTRPARPGDYCVLLASAGGPAQVRLRHYQEVLQSVYGGRPSEPVHLTCNRFERGPSSRISTFVNVLASNLTHFQTFPIVPQSYLPQFSPFRNINILKWKVYSSDQLLKIHAIIEASIAEAGHVSMYPPGWLSTLVTALEDIKVFTPETNSVDLTLPHPLFIAGEIIISRVNNYDNFQTIERLPFPTAKWKSSP